MKSIGFRLAVIMLVVLLLGIGITVGVSLGISGNAITRETLSKIKSDTESNANGMEAWLSYQCANLTTLADMLSQTDDYSEESLRPKLNSVLQSNPAYFEVYMGFPDGMAHTGSGYVFDYSWWHANERGWYKLALTDPSKAHITEPYTDAQTGELCITAVHAVRRNGTLLGVIAADIFVTDLQTMVRNTSVDDTGYAVLLTLEGDIIVHPNPDMEPDKDDNYQNIAQIEKGVYADLWKDLAKKDTTIKYGGNYYTANTLKTTGWKLMTALPVSSVSKPITTAVATVVPLTLLILVLTAGVIYIIIRRVITLPINNLAHSADELAKGNVDIKTGEYSGEMGDLARAFDHMAQSFKEQASLIERLAAGDLTVEALPRSDKDTVNQSLAIMTAQLNEMMSEFKVSIGQVADSSKLTADGSQALARDSSEQSSIVESLTSALDGISSNTKNNAVTAGQAASLAEIIKNNAEKGSRQMDEMMAAVREINEASQNIGKVIKVIDDIAFQTNILALNAAVEAARAGQHGKGFAVVAEEVRNLASKSAEAAKDTGVLITSSINKADLGAQIASDTASSLAEIVEGIKESSRLVAEMAVLSGSAEKEIETLKQGLDTVADGIRKNSLSAQESAAASQQMSGQAYMLENLVSRFKIKEGDGVNRLKDRF